MKPEKTRISEEQLRYANILNIFVVIGGVSLFVIFFLYIAGIPSARISPDKIPQYWDLPVEEYLIKIGVNAGWAWTGMLQYSDFLLFLPLALLLGIPLICYSFLAPIFHRKNDNFYLFITISQIAILILVASGVLTG